METARILGLRVDSLSMDATLEKIEEYIAARTPRHLVTADASMVVIAADDGELREIVDRADVVTADGFGIIWASKLLGIPIVDKVSGVDLVAQVARLSAAKGYRMYFLGAAPGVAQEAAVKLIERFPGACIAGSQDGYFDPAQESEIISRIRSAKPDVLFVAMGIPKQEKWIDRYKDALAVPVSVGIGGSFDVYSGKVKRAPLWMQRHGLEWLYRVCANPKKISKVMTLPRFAGMAIRRRIAGAAK